MDQTDEQHSSLPLKLPRIGEGAVPFQALGSDLLGLSVDSAFSHIAWVRRGMPDRGGSITTHPERQAHV